ncbi:hypothetical protein IJG92_02305 [Candidatus Saccharibacteria bacterium]|nr:hypothetical protein [Candidatus Saccharibacteria bacterium]MBQ6149983.1 hypothetical protein [Candidatus Saccharibacteria bacterium]
MNKYLVDEAVLSEAADALLKENPAMSKADLMQKLDHQITKAIVGSLTEEQGAELEKILDEGATEDAIDDFFAKYNINLEEVIKNAILEFKKDFDEGGAR